MNYELLLLIPLVAFIPFIVHVYRWNSRLSEDEKAGLREDSERISGDW